MAEMAEVRHKRSCWKRWKAPESPWSIASDNKKEGFLHLRCNCDGDGDGMVRESQPCATAPCPWWFLFRIL